MDKKGRLVIWMSTGHVPWWRSLFERTDEALKAQLWAGELIYAQQAQLAKLTGHLGREVMAEVATFFCFFWLGLFVATSIKVKIGRPKHVVVVVAKGLMPSCFGDFALFLVKNLFVLVERGLNLAILGWGQVCCERSRLLDPDFPNNDAQLLAVSKTSASQKHLRCVERACGGFSGLEPLGFQLLPGLVQL